MIIADVSSNNSRPINLPALAAAGVDALMVKATESTNYVNPYFGYDYRSWKDGSRPAGAYHFDHWLEDLRAQLDWFAAHYGPAAGDIAPWWDLESYRKPNGQWATLGVDLAWPAVIERCQIMLWCLRSHYGDGLIYCTRDTAAHLVAGGFKAETDLCIAQGTTGPSKAARIMQFPPVGIPGVAGFTDWSVA